MQLANRDSLEWCYQFCQFITNFDRKDLGILDLVKMWRINENLNRENENDEDSMICFRGLTCPQGWHHTLSMALQNQSTM